MSHRFIVIRRALWSTCPEALVGIRTDVRITDDVPHQRDPAISVSVIVWTDFRNGNGDICADDLTTGAETRITDDAVAELTGAGSRRSSQAG